MFAIVLGKNDNEVMVLSPEPEEGPPVPPGRGGGLTHA